MNTDVVLVGGFHEIIDLCRESGYNVVGIIDNNLVGSYYGIPIIGTDADADALYHKYSHCKIVVTPDSPRIREKLVNLYRALGYSFATIISPQAHISKSAVIGEGTVIQFGVNISASTKVGCFCKLNVNCNVMHDNTVADFTTIAPNAVLLGRVSTGYGSYIGANATVLPEHTIGSGSVVGAGAVVTHDVKDGITVKGVPAR